MKKIVLGGLLVLALAGCGAPDKVAPTENTKSVSQRLVPTAPGWISAFAGSGVRGYSPSGISAPAANLDSPSGLTLCPDGALYVSDTGNNRIVKFSGGTMTVVVAGQTTASGRPYGNLLVNPRAESPIVTPGAIPGWTVVSPASGWSEVPWADTRPEPLDGEQYFRASASAVAEMYQDVNVTEYMSGAPRFAFTGFVHSLSGDARPDTAQIIVEYRDTFGNVLSSYDSGPQAVRGEWEGISDSRTAPQSTKSIRVRLISTRNTGTGNDAYYDGLTLRAYPAQLTNGDGSDAILALLSSPHGLACDTDGSLYIADTYANVVRKVDSNGKIWTVAGGGGFDSDFAPAQSVALNLPMSVSINHGNANTGWLKLVVSDFLNHAVRGLTTSGSLITILRGNGSPCHPFDGTPESNYCAYYPMGVDAVGNTVDNSGTQEPWPGITVANRGNSSVLNVLAFSSSVPFGQVSPITSGPGFLDALDPPWAQYYDYHWSATNRPVAVTSVAADPSNTPLNPGLARGHFRGSPARLVGARSASPVTSRPSSGPGTAAVVRA